MKTKRLIVKTIVDDYENKTINRQNDCIAQRLIAIIAIIYVQQN
jgi:hypothetical protein